MSAGACSESERTFSLLITLPTPKNRKAISNKAVPLTRNPGSYRTINCMKKGVPSRKAKALP
jgi:hypothetical protein